MSIISFDELTSCVLHHGEFEENTKGTDYVVGDLHGHYTTLMKSLKKIGFDKKKDRLFCVGDLMDRGKQNIACAMLLKEDWFFCCAGNHEFMFIDAISDYEVGLFINNGGMWATGVDDNKLKMIFELLKKNLYHSMTVYVDGRAYGIMHTPGSNPDFDWRDLESIVVECGTQSYMMNVDLFWSRSLIQKWKYAYNQDFLTDGNLPERYTRKNVERIYVGHTPRKNLTTFNNISYIDHGVCFGFYDEFPIYRIGDSEPVNNILRKRL